MGVIRIKDMEFYGYHGVSSAEKALGTRFQVDLELFTDTASPARTDDLSLTINYEQVFDVVRDFLTNERFHLIETLAERLVDEIYNRFSPRGVCVRVRKVSPPIPGHIGFIEVETKRGICSDE
ncbi:dihydroneopterin aldolase [bacterium]|nr:dihydroneopterin aldolase [bacterium]